MDADGVEDIVVADFLRDNLYLLTNQAIASSVNANTPIIQAIKVFPNPTKSFLSLQIEGQQLENGIYQIYDQLGRIQQSGVLAASGQSQFKLPLTQLSNGSYYLKVQTKGGQVYQAKFVVIK